MKFKDTFFSKKLTLNIRGSLFELSPPKVMGVLNITPDSFYDGGKYMETATIITRVEQLLSEGASFIDIGAYSSRPGAAHIPEDEEYTRLKPVIALIRKRYPEAVLSIDTFRSGIAKRMVEEFGVDMINDISAGRMDHEMYETVASLGVPYIIMHMQGTPRDMQKKPHYQNVTREILTFFSERVRELKLLGVNDIIVDPGFGFGKTLDHNYELMNQLETFKILELPVMVGLSRKSMIYKLLKATPSDALNGTTVLHTVALLKGADILRTHDIREAVEAITIIEKLKEME
ncbi:MAG: dihydropteroate synthase [Bacteroidales bacterium]|nr:MAG: dihydropteroate synthase [Bacteroidales bacterium]